MKYLITGGAGFIGKSLIMKLLENPDNIIFNIDKLNYSSSVEPINTLSLKLKNNNHKFFKIDLANKEEINKVIQVCNPDIIFHLAAESHVDRSIISPSDFIQSNIIGTFNLLEASLKHYKKLNSIRKKQFKFLHISTDEVFGSLDNNGSFCENSSYDPRSPYSASKASSDHLVKAWFHTFNLPIIISNCSNNFGPWQYPEKFIPKIILNAINNKKIPIYGNGFNIRDWLFVDDHISALLLLSKEGRIGESYCIGGNGEKTNNQVVMQICSILDKKFPDQIPHMRLIEYVKDRPGHDYRYSINFEKIRRAHGWEPKYNFSEGITKTVDWYISNLAWVEKLNRQKE